MGHERSKMERSTKSRGISEYENEAIIGTDTRKLIPREDMEKHPFNCIGVLTSKNKLNET